MFKNLNFIAVSHSSASATQQWIRSIGGAGDVTIIVDESRALYALWGLGISNTWHLINPWTAWNQIQLGKDEQVWAKTVESGNRWQTSGSWGIDKKGVVRWGGQATSADDIPIFRDGCRALGAN
jgi:AhpC/TSA antioxidant enzyme